MSGFTSDQQLAAAISLAKRLCGKRHYASYRELLNAAGAKLMRRGFSMPIARSACDAAWDGTLDSLET